MAYLEQSTRYIEYDSRLGGRYRYLPPARGARVDARRALRRADRRAVPRRYSELLPTMLDWARRAVPEGARRLRLRLQADDQGEGVRRGARHAARGDAVERRHLRHRPGLRGAAAAHARPPAARGPPLRRPDAHGAAQGRPVVPHPGRPARAGRRLEPVPRGHPGPHRRRRAPDLRPTRTAEPRPGVTLIDFDPEGEDKVLAAICYPQTNLPEDQMLARVRALGTDERVVAARARTWGSAPTVATSRAARSSAPTTASTCSPTTARSATCNGTACSRSSGSRCHPTHGYDVPESVVEAGVDATRSCKAMDVLGRAVRRDGVPVPRAGVVRGVARVPAALRDADERTRGDAPDRAAYHAAGSPRVPASSPRRCTG